jgi:hypothetical protein
MNKERGASALELVVVVGIVLAVAGIGIPILWDALQTVKDLLALASQVVVK